MSLEPPKTKAEVRSSIEHVRVRIWELEAQHPLVYKPLRPLLIALVAWMEQIEALTKESPP